MASNYQRTFGLSSITGDTNIKQSVHLGTPIVVNVAAATAITLPSATGTGNTYSFIGGITATGDLTITTDDIFVGGAVLSKGDGFTAGATDNTITLNGTTTGGVAGYRVVVTDVADGVWNTSIVSVATGTAATPFS